MRTTAIVLALGLLGLALAFAGAVLYGFLRLVAALARPSTLPCQKDGQGALWPHAPEAPRLPAPPFL